MFAACKMHQRKRRGGSRGKLEAGKFYRCLRLVGLSVAGGMFREGESSKKEREGDRRDRQGGKKKLWEEGKEGAIMLGKDRREE